MHSALSLKPEGKQKLRQQALKDAGEYGPPRLNAATDHLGLILCDV
jgi:hypothetical protein